MKNIEFLPESRKNKLNLIKINKSKHTFSIKSLVFKLILKIVTIGIDYLIKAIVISFQQKTDNIKFRNKI